MLIPATYGVVPLYLPLAGAGHAHEGNLPTAEALDSVFAVKLQRVMQRLEKQGYQPKIASGWRTSTSQSALHASGASQVSFSFHQAVDATGRPAAKAADIIDKRYGWKVNSTTAAFFRALGREAKREGLYWGGDWSQKNEWAKYGMGWDPAHVQLHPNSMLSKVKEASLYALQHPAAAAKGAGTAWLVSWGVAAAVGLTAILVIRARQKRQERW